MINSSRKKIFFLIVTVIIIIFLAILNYNNSINKILSQTTFKLLSENTRENMNDFQKEINTRIDFLKTYCYKNQQKNYEIGQYFSRIELININNISDKKYFSSLSENKFYISEPFIENETQNIFIVVLKEDFAIRGTCSANSFENVFHAQDFLGNVSTYITTNSGKIIVMQDDKNLFSEKNIFNEYIKSKFKNIDDFYYMIHDLENGLEGFAEYQYNFHNQVVNYRPLGINNWYMFSIIPKEVALEQSQDILSSTAYLLIIILSGLSIFIFYIVFTEKKRITEVETVNQKLNVVTENIPGGVQSRLNDSDFTITYVSYGFLRITGYDSEEIYNFFDNKYIAMIYFEDIPLVKKNIMDQLNSDGCFQVEYRLIKKNGQIIWVTERGQLVNDLIHSVLIDITELKGIWDELKTNEEKYKLIAQESDSIVFEFNIKSGLAYSSENFKKIFGFDLPMQNFPKSIIDEGLIYDDDTQILLTLLDNLKLGQVLGENEFRIKNKNGELIWCRLSMKLILDKKKRPLKAVGKIENINEWKTEQEKLKLRAQTDLLTGLYNKITTQKLINEYLLENGKEKINALMSIDIDNFKGVNDNLGHLVGDKVLVDIAGKLKKLFRQSDIIGRFGGDEFVVFLKDIPNQMFAENKANEILQNIRAKVNGNDKCKISASVGISIYPQNGLNFKRLYKNADDALYQAKKIGKDSWKLF